MKYKRIDADDKKPYKNKYSTKLREQSKEYMLFCTVTMPNQTAVLYN